MPGRCSIAGLDVVGQFAAAASIDGVAGGDIPVVPSSFVWTIIPIGRNAVDCVADRSPFVAVDG